MKGEWLGAIGAVVLTLILFAIPVVTTCCIIFKWDNFLEWVLCLLCLCEMAFLFSSIMSKVYD